jgi:hypothetical protein
MSRTLMFAITATLALAGCGSKKDPGDKPAPAGSAMTPPPAGSAAVTPPAGSAAVAPPATGSAVAPPATGSAAGPVDVPTEEDFESQAKTDITTATVDTKVKAIEDQLGQQ